MKTLFYPSAGNEDWKNTLVQFLDSTDKFIFADINYSENHLKNFKRHVAEVGLITAEEKIGTFSGQMTIVSNGKNSYRHLEPAYYHLHVTIKNIKKIITFRKGFGQYALNELDENGLHVFYHRGDSVGESGSNVFYLANRHARHKPLEKLFNVLSSKLTNNSVIVSDGSNTDFKQFKILYRNIKDLDKQTVIDSIVGKEISILDTTLKCIDVLDRRHNHTLAWEVSKNEFL